MNINNMLSRNLVKTSLSVGSKEEVIRELSILLYKEGRIGDLELFIKDVFDREAISVTSLEDGIAIPHAKSNAVKEASIAIGILDKDVDWQDEENKGIRLVFMIATPEGLNDAHVEALSELTSKLLNDNLVEKLKEAKDSKEVLKLLLTSENEDEVEEKKHERFIIGVTGCPVGVAHTYMAAEALEKAAKENNCSIKVETNGSIGVKNEPSTKEIEEAEAIIVACDKQIDMDRFAGKKVLIVGVKEAIRNGDNLVKEALVGDMPVYKGSGSIKAEENRGRSGRNNLYKYLMNGVSYMIPFVVIGGLLIAISLAIGGKPTPAGLQIPEGSFWNSILNIGVTGFTLMIPILAGYIAYAIGDKPALAPGMIGGWIANNGSFYGAEAGTGFIGAIVAGFLVGYFVKWIKTINFPKMIEPLVPIMIIPITSTLFIGSIFILIIGAPIASLMTSLNNMLVSMSAGSLILIGLVIGLMQGFDMGGPFGKVAFMFSVGLIAEGQSQFMGAQAMAIPVAPLGMGLATIIGKKFFEKEEIENGKAALAMGFVGISEGAIPFAASDPFAVIPANMIGSAVACILGFMFGITNSVAHGGPILLLLGALNKPLLAIIAMAIGSIVTAFVAIGLKSYRQKKRKQK